MHGVLITFTSSLSADDIAQPFHDYAVELQSVPGLISKTWLSEHDTLGGFHVFVDAASAELYLSSDLVAGLMSTTGFRDFEVKRFHVLSELSAMTGVRAASAEVAR